MFDHSFYWLVTSLSDSNLNFLDVLAPKTEQRLCWPPNPGVAQRAIGPGLGLWLVLRTEKLLRVPRLAWGLTNETEQGE